MWKLKATVIAGVLIGAAIFGATVAYGSWWWNAQIDVEGVDVRTIWTVVDDPEGSENYHAKIQVRLPRGAKAELVSQAKTETVVFARGRSLKCTDDGIQAKVKYKVKPLEGAEGKHVDVTVTADGEVVGHNTGKVNRTVKVKVLIPGSCSG